MSDRAEANNWEAARKSMASWFDSGSASILVGLYSGQHPLNLWRMKAVLNAKHNAGVTEIFTDWIHGSIPESARRRSLIDSGEMVRWDTVRLRAREQRRLVQAFDAVSGLLNSVPPSAPVTQSTRANGLLRQALDCLRHSNSELR